VTHIVPTSAFHNHPSFSIIFNAFISIISKGQRTPESIMVRLQQRLINQLILLLVVVVFHASVSCHAFVMMPPALPVGPTTTTQNPALRLPIAVLLFANKAKKASMSDDDTYKGMGKNKKKESSTPLLNWCPTPIPRSDLPTIENQVVLLETQLPLLKNRQTNPKGAVAVTKYDGQTYCFDIACPACKIPLTKAICRTIPDVDDDEYVLEVITCDFCKATYELETGERQTESADQQMGFLGSMANKVFASSPANSGPLKFYKLGEKNGQVLISFD
jgi:nitrite reductase/ring-hydroxylating ferredoxin subunit